MARKFVSASMLRLADSIGKSIKPLKKKKSRRKKVTEELPVTKHKSQNTGSSGTKITNKVSAQKPSSPHAKTVVKQTKASSIVTREHIVTQKEKESFRDSVNLRTKYFVRKSLQCEICDQYFSSGYRYSDREGYISYLCVSCAKQIGGPSGRKLIISTPMGGQNKKY